ncbi:DUF2628 domain-containing protein [Aquabacter sp. L1I39]|uniref:DUF2628 domain-containing protein n=1 Tax=Aquabacter sp. L1I39 TaxID=2820278 RepID=UPI001ADA1006|nr:DUF2628 domain-containing protein [Aquabacter sp. L1I39]QTL02842.1 DUF2628 domain-containing protein [Aquabacter sp. L1I39]
MAVWSVLTLDQVNDTPMRSAERVVMVRDKVSVLAFLFAPLALLRYRLWLAFAAYLVVSAVLAVSEVVLGLPEIIGGAVTLGLHLLVALELSDLRVQKLRRRGYEEAGVVVGRDRDEAERRFFKNWTPRSLRPNVIPPRPSRPGASIIGSFPEPRAS